MRKTPASESFFDKVSGWRLETLLKKRIRRKCFFSVIVAAFLNKRYWTKLEEVSRRCSVEKMFLEIPQNSKFLRPASLLKKRL